MTLFRPPARRDANFLGPDDLVALTRGERLNAGTRATPERAKTLIPVMASANLIANAAALMPLQEFSSAGDDLRPLPEGQKDVVLVDPVGGDRRTPTIQSWVWEAVSIAAVRGDVLGVKQGDPLRPSRLTLVDPYGVATRIDSDGMLEYKIGRSWISAVSVWHFRRYPRPGQVFGLSPIEHFAEALGLALNSRKFGSDFFADGAHPSSILTTDQPVTEVQARTIKDRFMASVRGSREPAVLGAGVKYTPVQVAPEESQFLETQKMTAADICRIWGPGVAEILGYDSGASMTYANIEQRMLHLLLLTIDPWLVLLEESLSTLLPRPRTVKFDRNALLRTTAKDRWDVASTRLKLGAATINEVRAEEGSAPVGWGEEPWLPSIGPSAAAAALNNDPAAAKQEAQP